MVKAMTIRQVVFLSIGKGSAGPGTLNRYLLILKRLIFESSDSCGQPEFRGGAGWAETCP